MFLDFAKAFDRVPHNILLQKLFNFGVGGSLLNSFGVQISCMNVIRESSSTASTLPGLMLHQEFPRDLYWILVFSLYVFISDPPDVVCSGNTIALYADDCKTSRVIDNSHDHALFLREPQQSLDLKQIK